MATDDKKTSPAPKNGAVEKSGVYEGARIDRPFMNGSWPRPIFQKLSVGKEFRKGSSFKDGPHLWPCHAKCAMSQPMISALSSIEPSRPERPLWPASMSVLNKRSCVSVLFARSRATHLAGSA